MSFKVEDAEHVVYPHDDPIAFTLKVLNSMIHRILVDGGSSANILLIEGKLGRHSSPKVKQDLIRPLN